MFTSSYIQTQEAQTPRLTNHQISFLKQKFAEAQDQGILQVLKSLSDPTKFCIYMLLTTIDEVPVRDISVTLEISQSAVSHALSDLKKLGLVTCKHCGKLRCYSLNTQSKNHPILQSFLQDYINK